MLEAFRDLSARIGRDKNLVQAGGGNTSIKDGDTLWVKASGKWLARAGQEDMFLPVPLETCFRCMEEGRDCIEQFQTTSGELLRPSVETTMHAVLPQRVVIHVHSVNTIAWAVRTNAEEILRMRLSGVRWEWIPYIKPGYPMARKIRHLIDSDPDVLVLGNHGLVVAGEDCEAAAALLADVERRLDIRPAAASEPGLVALTELTTDTEWQAARDPEVHAIATNPLWCGIAEGGTLYPDHCVYLGPAAAVLREGETIAEVVNCYRERYDFDPVAVLVEGQGVIVSSRITKAAQEMLVCLKRVAERIDQAAVLIQYLDDGQVAALMNWDAEKYRIALASQHDEQLSR